MGGNDNSVCSYLRCRNSYVLTVMMTYAFLYLFRIDPTASCASKTSGLRFIDDKITRPQRGRTVFSAKQLHELEKVFITDQYISGQQRRRLSGQLGLTETQVRVWFQNRRIKWRKQKLERKIKLWFISTINFNGLFLTEYIIQALCQRQNIETVTRGLFCRESYQ